MIRRVIHLQCLNALTTFRHGQSALQYTFTYLPVHQHPKDHTRTVKGPPIFYQDQH